MLKKSIGNETKEKMSDSFTPISEIANFDEYVLATAQLSEAMQSHLSKLYFNKPKLPRTFSACCRSVVYLSMAIYTKKLKSTKDFGKKHRFYP